MLATAYQIPHDFLASTREQVADQYNKNDSMSGKMKYTLQCKINSMSAEDHISIIKLILKNTLNAPKKVYTATKNGTYLDLNDLDNQLLWKLENFVTPTVAAAAAAAAAAAPITAAAPVTAVAVTPVSVVAKAPGSFVSNGLCITDADLSMETETISEFQEDTLGDLDLDGGEDDLIEDPALLIKNGGQEYNYDDNAF
jgi:hypothetical protein